MSIENRPFKIGQVTSLTHNYGLVLYTYFCGWTQDKAYFFYTKVYGGMPLKSSRADNTKVFGPPGEPWTYAKTVQEVQNFLAKDNVQCVEPVWTRERISDELAKRRQQQQGSATYVKA